MIKAIDFFCGGGGMTHGLLQSGIQVIAGIDIDPKCKDTYQANNTPARFINADIKTLSEDTLTQEIGIEKDDDDMVFIGCSPCQYWSLMHTDRTKAEDSKNLLNDFKRFVNCFNPGFVVIENVPGIFLKPESPLKEFIEFLSSKNYSSIEYKIIKVSGYGVPQSRKRFVLLASRVKQVSFPQSDTSKIPTVRDFIGEETQFPKIEAGHVDETEFCHTASGLSNTNLSRLALTPLDGGTRSAWQDTEWQLDVYKRNADDKRFSFRDVYGRMFWDKPAPTITTRFHSLSNGRFGHPEQHRAISLREGATLQTFPLDYVFKAETVADKARLIGNAVPPELARRIGESILKSK